MSHGVSSFVLDSDVLITAKNRYYACSICPGFWDTFLMLQSLRIQFHFAVDP